MLNESIIWSFFCEYKRERRRSELRNAIKFWNVQYLSTSKLAAHKTEKKIFTMRRARSIKFEITLCSKRNEKVYFSFFFMQLKCNQLWTGEKCLNEKEKLFLPTSHFPIKSRISKISF